MTYCLHPICQKPENIAPAKFCKACGRSLLLGNRYRALKILSQNSTSRRFLAIDEHQPTKPKCVIEQFLPLGTNVPISKIKLEIAEIFTQEAANLELLNKHPKTPKMLAFFPKEQYPTWVKEYIDGQSIAKTLNKTGPYNQTQIRNLLAEVLPVLEFAHSQNILHSDITPENIINTPEGKHILTGFGCAQLAYKTAKFRPGSRIGTPPYTAPEQTRGQTTNASDIYSLGLTCIHLLTGISPIKLYDKSKKTWIWQETLGQNTIIRELAFLLDKMIERSSAERYQSIREIRQDFARLPDVLYASIDALNLDQKQFIVKQAIASALPGKNLLFRIDVDAMTGQEVTEKIYETLRKFTILELEKAAVTEKQILSVWQKHTIQIVEQMDVPQEWEEKKERVIGQLETLHQIPENTQKQAQLEIIAKEILEILFESMSEKEKTTFSEKVVEEAEKQNVKIAKNQLTPAKIKALLGGGATGLRSAAEPVVRKIIIERLSQGFLIPILATAIGIQQFRNWGIILAGPLGWGLVILTALGSGVSAVGKYRKERKKVLFIQTLFSIYTYSIKAP
ncbi:serine/threonine protein kinase [Ancylothrix sp. C2]|uniref:serine/threonine-protein kinase n=1 Tax=Ancylothrix sp. D3o TaxID=2953691 RepID=UPI0021BB3B6D|nr:serine/threonine-protein kinase [Ancylothrix sp. D3o]MCT7951865.1 serine/threonine protein kinase [Ancylothrix sp. D3o]